MFKLEPLPFAPEALEPYISARTLEFHYGRHHKAYVDKLNELVSGSDLENASLGEAIAATAGNPEKQAVFNNAAQAYNHDFFWHCLKPAAAGTAMPESLEKKIVESFGSKEKLFEEFKAAALKQFGSGWTWLVADGGQLRIMTTANADTPIAHGLAPIFTVDVWEHAYYLDYQNRRGDFVAAVLEHLADWEAAAERL